MRGEGENTQKNLNQAQRIKNQQSALINVWRMSGIDAERFRWKHSVFASSVLTTTEKKKQNIVELMLSDTQKFAEGEKSLLKLEVWKLSHGSGSNVTKWTRLLEVGET